MTFLCYCIFGILDVFWAVPQIFMAIHKAHGVHDRLKTNKMAQKSCKKSAFLAKKKDTLGRSHTRLSWHRNVDCKRIPESPGRAPSWRCVLLLRLKKIAKTVKNGWNMGDFGSSHVPKPLKILFLIVLNRILVNLFLSIPRVPSESPQNWRYSASNLSSFIYWAEEAYT